MAQTYTLTSDRAAEDLPFLMVSPAGSTDAPLVLLLHGLGGRKESYLPSLYAFARQGFRAVAPDARLHGERMGADERDRRLQAGYLPTLFEIVNGSAADVPVLLDYLGAKQAAVHGISLGGYITFAALVFEPRLTVASVAMGSPDWLEGLDAVGLAPGQPAYDLVARLNPLDQAAQTYPPRPLLLLHGEQDDVVSIRGVRALYSRLSPVYAEMPERLELKTYPGLGHHYTEDMHERTLAWIKHFMFGEQRDVSA
ncbi:MAG: alpha/beta fold hydrolase [Armatimonadota bacterium]|nr:alpha/beta fold hydrolase [Armatimonadota bacterium]